jgi:hypothetical protein
LIKCGWSSVEIVARSVLKEEVSDDTTEIRTSRTEHRKESNGDVRRLQKPPSDIGVRFRVRGKLERVSG